MFFIALFFVILLGIFAVIVIVQNLETLVYTPIHLTVFSQHLPGAPIVLLCVLCAFLGALALYLSVVRSANRDKQEIKELRTRIEELERAPTRSPSGGLVGNFAPSVVPMPGFASGNQAGSGSPGSSAPPGQRQPPPNALQNTSPSATSNNLSLPPRMFPPSQQPPQQPQMGGGPHPPFPHA